MTLQIETTDLTKISTFAIMLTGEPTYKGNKVRRDHSFTGSLYHAARRAKFLVNRFGAKSAFILPQAN